MQHCSTRFDTVRHRFNVDLTDQCRKETEFDEESPEEEVDDDYVEEVKRRTHSASGSCVSSSDSDDDSPCESTASLDFDECIESDKPYEILAQGRSASNTATYLVRWARLDGEAGSIENASWESDEETVEELMVDWAKNGAPVKKTAKKTSRRYSMELSLEEKKQIRDLFRA